MAQRDDVLGGPQFEAWRDSLRSMNPEDIEPRAFADRVRPVNVYGFTALPPLVQPPK